MTALSESSLATQRVRPRTGEGEDGHPRGASNRLRLAFVVSHPIQYCVPLYRRIAPRPDVTTRVFYTWHDGSGKAWDHGFKRRIAWDIPLTAGYDHELVPNRSSDPGTHHFRGLVNPGLVESVVRWRPDAVHVTGYAYASHLRAMRALSRGNIPVLFRGDSHMLDPDGPWKAIAKKLVLSRVFRYPTAFVYVGTNNREYYRAFGVPESKLFPCPHSIECERFAGPDEILERNAAELRASLGLTGDKVVLLFAGKFERKKRPVELMKAVADARIDNVVLLMAGDGELRDAVNRMAQQLPRTFKLLPFQNQSRMPIIYRVGDIFVLPSARDETWGLAVNEAMACGRPVLVSDRVGCATDMVLPGVTGDVFRTEDWGDFRAKLSALVARRADLKKMGDAARKTASRFDIEATEAGLTGALEAVCPWWHPVAGKEE